MTNGSNAWGVSFSRIVFFETILRTHKNIERFIRSSDILFNVRRFRQQDSLLVLCCDEYVKSLVSVYRALDEFGKIDIIYVGGNWNAYTKQAKDYCLDQKIGLYNAVEINGALFLDEYWDYCTKNSNGDPEYFYKSA